MTLKGARRWILLLLDIAWLAVFSHHATLRESAAGFRVSLKPWYFTWMSVVSTGCSRAHFGELRDHVFQ